LLEAGNRRRHVESSIGWGRSLGGDRGVVAGVVNGSKRAALVVAVATAASLLGVGAARARVGFLGRRDGGAVLAPCASPAPAHPRCNLLVLANTRAWRGTGTASAGLPPLTLPGAPGLPTFPTFPPLTFPPATIPNLLGPAPTSTTVAPTTTVASTTTTTAPPILGFGPAELQSAYAVEAGTATSDVIAIVEGGGAPSAESDLGVYRSHFGLPECSTANGCLQIVDENDRSTQPPPDDVWALETAADLDMASAMCPACHLLLVQASAETLADLATANNTAAALGAAVIDDSWAWDDGSDPGTLDDTAYTHAGAVTVAAGGDFGYSTDNSHPEGVAEFPADSPNVVAVGGTSLTRDSSARGWTESAFSRSESGCSTHFAKPSWQASLPCSFGRATADVAAVADPTTGVAIYDSQGYLGEHGWMVAGGTSVSSAIVAGVYGAAGNAAALASGAPQHLYEHAADLHDVTVGSNGDCPDAPARCTAAPGWDGPTGNGTPAGVAAF
jgi:hypothetical protein